VLPAYEEEIPLPAWFQLILLAGLAAIAFAVIASALSGLDGAGTYAVYYLAMTVAFVFVVFAFVTFRRLTIAISDDEVRFGFGVLRKSIPLERIQACEPKRYKWLTYGGWGIRFALGGRRAWSVPGVAGGVELTVAEGRRVRRYFVSSRYPELLAESVGDRPGLPSAAPQ
jgi:hypothetical protein